MAVCCCKTWENEIDEINESGCPVTIPLTRLHNDLSMCPIFPFAEILRETTRVGQNVVLPCGRTPESRQALANKTVVLWLAVPRGASPSGVHSGTITIPIVTRKKTEAGHTFKSTDRNERLVVNYENASLSVLNVTLADRKDFYCRVFRGPVCVYVVHVQLIVVGKKERGGERDSKGAGSGERGGEHC